MADHVDQPDLSKGLKYGTAIHNAVVNDMYMRCLQEMTEMTGPPSNLTPKTRPI